MNEVEEAKDSSAFENLEAEFQWTQEKDDILISQYKQFESLGSRGCYELLSSLIPGTTAKDCHRRGKALKLKLVTDEEAKKISRQLNTATSSSLSNKKVSMALQKFILAKLEKQPGL